MVKLPFVNVVGFCAKEKFVDSETTNGPPLLPPKTPESIMNLPVFTFFCDIIPFLVKGCE